MAADLSHDPRVLYHASIERIEAAHRARQAGDFVMAMYLSGLAVECILQAICFLDDPSHDARHDLSKWLKKCRASFHIAINADDVCSHWTTLLAVWRSRLRYLSEDGLLGHLRAIKHDRYISGGRDAIIKVNADRLIESAVVVHRKGITAWRRYTTK